MAGKKKGRIEYAGWDVDIFDGNSAIDELVDAQGWTGFSVYFYLCQKAYGTDGYFYRWSYSNAPATARRMGGGVGSETVKQVVALCLRIGLFDNRLFEEEGVLTSKDIQERYMLAIEKRSEMGRTVDPVLWLLNSDETKPYIVIPSKKDSLPENGNNLPENDDSLPIKESKVKKSKEDISILAGCADSAVQQQAEDILSAYHEICMSYPTVVLKASHVESIADSLSEFTTDDFRRAFEVLEKNPYLKGLNEKNWKAQFGWVVKRGNLRKVLGGVYDRHGAEDNADEDPMEKYKCVINKFD